MLGLWFGALPRFKLTICPKKERQPQEVANSSRTAGFQGIPNPKLQGLTLPLYHLQIMDQFQTRGLAAFPGKVDVVEARAPQVPVNDCAVCQRLELTEEYLKNRFDQLDPLSSKSISFEILVASLTDSALRGCDSCAILKSACEAFSDHLVGRETEGTIDHEPETIRYPLYRSPVVRKIYLYYPLIPESPDGQTLRLAFNTDYNNTYELYTIREHPVAPFNTICRQSELPVDATESIPILKEWMNDCKSSHPDCSSERLPLPTRVIDVGHEGSKSVKLYISNGAIEPYAALSHCWGKNSLLVTNAGNIEDHKEKIPWDDLSRTFKDAITCTQNLGLRYLWIDSLCIKQGDIDDWAFECRRMGLIYRGAEIVLAATAAAEGDQGLLNQRKWFIPARTIFSGIDHQGIEYQVRMRRSVSNRRQHYLWCNSDRVSTSVDCELAPLSTRAWAFQEQWLARRYVHFKQEEMIFECQTSTRCECLYVQNSRHNTPKDTFSFRQTVRKEGKETEFQLWQSLVKEFIIRRLTYASDFLPAMSGLAREMQAVGAGEYLGGMWKETLINNLLWRVSAARAVPYRAPTWSWASIDFYQKCSPFWLDCGYSGPKTAKIINVKCSPSTTDPTGAVHDGHLIISGPMLRVTEPLQIPQRERSRYRPYLLKNKLDRDPATYDAKEQQIFCFQTDFKLSSLEDLFFFLIRVDRGSRGNTPEGLVLQKRSSEEPYNVYERVGVFLWPVDITSLESDGKKVTVQGKGAVFDGVPCTTVKIV